MKNIFLLLFFLCNTNILWGQNREILKQNKFNSATFKNYEIEVKKKWLDSIKINFPGEVEFVDGRADKSKIGFVRMGEHNSFYNFIFPGEGINYVNSKLHDVIKPSNRDSSLLIVVKHLWLSQLITKPESRAEKLAGAMAFISYCYFKADYYRKKGVEVQYVGETDTVISLRKWIGNVSDDLIKKTLTTALTTCNNLLSPSPTGYYPVEQLYDSLKNEFNYPILKCKEPKKGVYRNYEDFLNNNPVEADFNVKINKDDISLSSSAIDTSVTTTAWGYSDGIDVYKHLNKSYYKMNRVENTFELAGPRIIRQIHTLKEIIRRTAIDVFFGDFHSAGIMLLMIGSDEKIMRELIPYQLNIKEGTFY